jgi:hypothetical protein
VLLLPFRSFGHISGLMNKWSRFVSLCLCLVNCGGMVVNKNDY